MGRKVKVVTKCGEVHTYTYDQEVDTVEVVEKKNYPLQDRFNQIIKLYDEGCGGIHCRDCAFRMRGDSIDCTFVKAHEALQKAKGYDG